MIGLMLMTLIASTNTQSTSSIANSSVTIFQGVALSLYQDPLSPLYPNDFFLDMEIGTNNIYTLGSNGIVQVHRKADPSQKVQTFTNFSYGMNLAYVLKEMCLNQVEDLMILTSYSGSTLVHLVFSVSQDGIEDYQYTRGVHTFSTQPAETFIKGNYVYTYFSLSNSNDLVYKVNILNNQTNLYTLGVMRCKMAVTPDKSKALVWNNRSTVYIYSISDAFTLLHVYNLSYSVTVNRTGSISFSSDSQLAIVEVDTLKPVRVVNLTDFTTIANISVNGAITSTSFLDFDNRFLIVFAASATVIYDLKYQQFNTLTPKLLTSSITPDPQTSLIYNIVGDQIQAYGINITENNTTITSYPQLTQTSGANSTYSNTTDVNSTYSNSSGANSTYSNTTDVNSTYSNSSAIQNNEFQNVHNKEQFVLLMEYSLSENVTVSQLGQMLSVVDTVLQNSFSILFATPLVGFFFSIFNYFTLLSLYVLVDIRIPEAVFDYLAAIYNSCNSDLLSKVGLTITVNPLSSSQLISPRALYFGVTSDLFSANFIGFALMFTYFLLYELIIQATRVSFLRKKKFTQALKRQRITIYWGLVVSNIIPMIIAWNFTFMGSFSSYKNKINLGVQYILVGILPILVLKSFLLELWKAKGAHRLLKALRQWWDSYQNLIYPLCLLTKSPIYFLCIIGAGNIFAFVNSFYNTQKKLLAILKALYPLVFHCCFIVFYTSDSIRILSVTSILCLSVFLLGSIHHLLESTFIVLAAIFRGIKRLCKSSQVNPSTQSRKKKVEAPDVQKPKTQDDRARNHGVRFDDNPFVFRQHGEKKAASEVIQIINKISKDTVWIVSEIDPYAHRPAKNKLRTVRKKNNQAGLVVTENKQNTTYFS